MESVQDLSKKSPVSSRHSTINSLKNFSWPVNTKKKRKKRPRKFVKDSSTLPNLKLSFLLLIPKRVKPLKS